MTRSRNQEAVERLHVMKEFSAIQVNELTRIVREQGVKDVESIQRVLLIQNLSY